MRPRDGRDHQVLNLRHQLFASTLCGTHQGSHLRWCALSTPSTPISTLIESHHASHSGSWSVNRVRLARLTRISAHPVCGTKIEQKDPSEVAGAPGRRPQEDGREDGHPVPHWPGGQRSTPRSAERAARQPQIPCTPPPGGVDDEQMKRPGSGVEYGSSRTAGRVKNWVSD